jgi:hypothetical protein
VAHANGPDAGTESGVATLAPTPAADQASAKSPRRRRLPILGAIAAGILIVLVLILLLVNNLLAQAFSPSRATLDYFNAQSRGDVNTMWQNATYLSGDLSYNGFFNEAAVSAMMQLAENRDLHNVEISSIKSVDDNTASVTVSLLWHGTKRTLEFNVRKDPSNTHWLFYPGWRIQIPPTTLQLTLPNQPGNIFIDNIANPPGATGAAITTIMGFHRVTMESTNLYDSTSQVVDALSPAAITLKGSLSASAIAAINQEVRTNLTTACDANKYEDCPGHTYTAPDQNFIYYWKVPGHGNVDYTRYVFNLTGDPTAGMSMTVSADQGKVIVSGTCTTTLTVNGSSNYKLKGTFKGTLTWNGSGFDSDLTVGCDESAG